jgi:hypothetical protein
MRIPSTKRSFHREPPVGEEDPPVDEGEEVDELVEDEEEEPDAPLASSGGARSCDETTIRRYSRSSAAVEPKSPAVGAGIEGGLLIGAEASEFSRLGKATVTSIACGGRSLACDHSVNHP